ncbi:MAG: hypothetical protein JO157_05890 [Acetobacteraceae bacterium]|nr:hypothetical protein [Acetobacteraceae bacterium]
MQSETTHRRAAPPAATSAALPPDPPPPALLAATGLSVDELPAFCAVVAAVLEWRHDRARGMALRLWRCGQRQLSWVPEVRRLVLYAGPWSPGGAVPTPEDVRQVEGALGLTEDDPIGAAWRSELESARAVARDMAAGDPAATLGHHPP